MLGPSRFLTTDPLVSSLSSKYHGVAIEAIGPLSPWRRSPLLASAFCCLFTLQSRARLKREQGQTEADDLQEHPVERRLIW